MHDEILFFSDRFEMRSVEYMNVDILTRSATVFGRLGILGSNFRSAIWNRRLCCCFLNNRLCELIDQCKPIKIKYSNLDKSNVFHSHNFQNQVYKKKLSYLSSVAPCLSGIACC